MTVAASRWRSDGYQDSVGLSYRGCEIRNKIEPAILHVILNKAIEIWFKDRDFATLKCCDLDDVLINACNVVSEVRKTRTRYKTNVSGSDNRYTHAYDAS